jgi:hypothetical protein
MQHDVSCETSEVHFLSSFRDLWSNFGTLAEKVLSYTCREGFVENHLQENAVLQMLRQQMSWQ